MIDVSARSLRPAMAWTRPAAPPPEELSLGLLRHHTKNALQRILADAARLRGLEETRGGRALMLALERRVMLSASLSDALFGLTRRPGALEDRLRSVCEATVELMGDPDQILRLTVTVEGMGEGSMEGGPPEALRATLLRAAHEMVGNAVKHGMHARLLGHIGVRLSVGAERTRLVVEDDGWGYAGARDGGEGLGLVRALAAMHDGTATLARIQDGTRAAMELPHAPPAPAR